MDDNQDLDQNQKKIKCPYCEEEEITVPEEIEVGDFLTCEHCAAEVEVVSTEPLEVRLVLEEK